MKVYITKDEWYPVYEIEYGTTVYDSTGFEITEEELEEYKEWVELTRKVQEFLQEKYRGRE